MKREVARFDFKAFGQAIKAARKAKGISRNQLADKMNIAPRYIASIENSGQHPSLQIFYELVTLLDVSVDQFFFPNKETDKAAYRAAHESSLILFEAAAKAVKPALVGGKLPNVAALQAEYVKLQEQKETLYADYDRLKKQVKEYDVIKRNIDSILRRESEPERGKENVRG